MAKRFFAFDLNTKAMQDLGEHETQQQADSAFRAQGGKGWVGDVEEWRAREEMGMILRDDRQGQGQGYLASVTPDGVVSVKEVAPEDEPFNFGGPMFGGEGQFRNGKITHKT